MAQALVVILGSRKNVGVYDV